MHLEWLGVDAGWLYPKFSSPCPISATRKLEGDGTGRVIFSTNLDREGDAMSGATILRADEE